MACRGTGRVISNLGGTPSQVECPWCGGSGLRPAEADAQAHWQSRQAEADEGADAGAAEDEPAADGESEAPPPAPDAA